METNDDAKAPKLRGSDRFQAADFLVGRYVAKVPTGTTLTEVLHPRYFENHFDRMRSGMEITVLSDDFGLDARIRVLTLTKTTAKFRILDVYAGGSGDEQVPQVETADVTVNFGGPNHRWRFMHGKTVIKHGFITEAEANEAALEYIDQINKQ